MKSKIQGVHMSSEPHFKFSQEICHNGKKDLI